MGTMTVYEKIKAMQPTEENEVWMVGEQLADICRAEGSHVKIDKYLPRVEITITPAEEWQIFMEG